MIEHLEFTGEFTESLQVIEWLIMLLTYPTLLCLLIVLMHSLKGYIFSESQFEIDLQKAIRKIYLIECLKGEMRKKVIHRNLALINLSPLAL